MAAAGNVAMGWLAGSVPRALVGVPPALGTCPVAGTGLQSARGSLIPYPRRCKTPAPTPRPASMNSWCFSTRSPRHSPAEEAPAAKCALGTAPTFPSKTRGNRGAAETSRSVPAAGGPPGAPGWPRGAAQRRHMCRGLSRQARRKRPLAGPSAAGLRAELETRCSWCEALAARAELLSAGVYCCLR